LCFCTRQNCFGCFFVVLLFSVQFGLLLKIMSTLVLTFFHRRYRTTHQERTKQQQRPESQDSWTWEEILDGKGHWTQAGEYRHPKAELEAAKAERRRYEEAARQHGWK
jgi:ABC-type transport system involved in cytochrome bd biosynthesis fused ATPase/permease subunit